MLTITKKEELKKLPRSLPFTLLEDQKHNHKIQSCVQEAGDEFFSNQSVSLRLVRASTDAFNDCNVRRESSKNGSNFQGYGRKTCYWKVKEGRESRVKKKGEMTKQESFLQKLRLVIRFRFVY